MLEKVQSKLDEGQEIGRIARELNLKADTLNKAIRGGRLKGAVKKKPPLESIKAAAAKVSAV